MHALSECGAHAQATRAPGDLGQLAVPGTEPTGKKRHKNPPAFYGMLLCPSETIRFQTDALAWTVAGADLGTLAVHGVQAPAIAGLDGSSGRKIGTPLNVEGASVWRDGRHEAKYCRHVASRVAFFRPRTLRPL